MSNSITLLTRVPGASTAANDNRSATAAARRSRRRPKTLHPPTAPERALAALFAAMGLEGTRREAVDLPGTPDLVCDAERIAGFAHGCWWHHHQGCAHGRLPERNRDWWARKFRRNRERDRRVREELIARGWRVVTLWACAARRGYLIYDAGDALDLLQLGVEHVEISTVPLVPDTRHMEASAARTDTPPWS